MQFLEIEGAPDAVLLRGVLRLYETIFGNDKTAKIHERVASKSNLHTVLAIENGEIVGFKMGYEKTADTFYSWLGGVADSHRRQGVAEKLMDLQHDWCMKKGYAFVQTKTMNRWRGMLILNLKNGFDILETYRDEQGALKIVLEKVLKT